MHSPKAEIVTCNLQSLLLFIVFHSIYIGLKMTDEIMYFRAIMVCYFRTEQTTAKKSCVIHSDGACNDAKVV